MKSKKRQLTRLSDLTLEVAIEDSDLLQHDSILFCRLVKLIHRLSAHGVEEGGRSAVRIGSIASVVSSGETALAKQGGVFQVRNDLRKTREGLILECGIGCGIACRREACKRSSPPTTAILDDSPW